MKPNGEAPKPRFWRNIQAATKQAFTDTAGRVVITRAVAVVAQDAHPMGREEREHMIAIAAAAIRAASEGTAAHLHRELYAWKASRLEAPRDDSEEPNNQWS